MASPRVRLVAFDMEGCLTAEPTVWELMHIMNDTWESHGRPYWERYRLGDIHYDEFARLDVAAWKGAPLAMLEAAAAQVPLMPGCAELLAALNDAGVAVAVISNGLLCAAERFRRDFGVQHIFANRAVVGDGGVLSGEIELLMPYDRKGEVLSELAAKLRIPPEAIAAVGDSPSDIAMFEQAGVSVAFGDCESGVAEAANVVRDGSLLALRDILVAPS